MRLSLRSSIAGFQTPGRFRGPQHSRAPWRLQAESLVFYFAGSKHDAEKDVGTSVGLKELIESQRQVNFRRLILSRTHINDWYASEPSTL